MPEQPQRPRFKDGQSLAAADLELAEESARNRGARHDRSLHTPGIALGLRIAKEEVPLSYDGQSVITLRLTLTAGVVMDGHGRQIVCANDVPLAPQQFEDDVVQKETDATYSLRRTSYPHPVFITADDRDGPAPAFGAGGCAGPAGPTRTIEDYQIRIGRRGEHLALATQATIGAGENLDAVTRPYRVLLGFVRYHLGLQRYVEVSEEQDHIAVHRAGIRAGEMVTQGSSLLLRAGDPAVAGQAALIVESGGGGRMRFGPTTADGGVAEVFSVTSEGDVWFGGKLHQGLAVGSVRTHSGIATDGMRLPLPPGVREDDVDIGLVALHITLTPRYPPAPDTAYSVARCEVDEQRVAHCRLVRLVAGVQVEMTALPVAACNFTVVAAVTAPAKQQGESP
jgi:hypothetical protein